ncbi:MAG: hypothetical protein AAFX94_01880 [Myxococcota bacterium]
MRATAICIVVSFTLAIDDLSAHKDSTQLGDDAWKPSIDAPRFAPSRGPKVGVDAAHGNFHTIEGRFGPFARLLVADGYQVHSVKSSITAHALQTLDVFVIANAGGDAEEWRLPTEPAFTSDEVRKLERWVRGGGSLLLIADHLPFPGAAESLAAAFDIVFLNGFAQPADGKTGTYVFRRDEGTLADHVITREIPAVKAFSGQAFRATREVSPLFQVPDNWIVLLPTEAWKFEPDTPRVSARGLYQAAVFEHGAGRVAVFGEAALFTAQSWTGEKGEVRRAGFADPRAPHNAKFVRNVLEWLTP